ncbi:AI-2E family transporter [Aquimonas sp.]|jgi:predicted PurR-regulated permease PerM|uniref:AI-2E family transporter n=1 Tax=Aquimonas sp. TaxID=1872588 RepID=UPI0037BEAFF3
MSKPPRAESAAPRAELPSVPIGATPVLAASALTRLLLVLVLVAGVYFFVGFLVPVLAALIIGFASWPLYQRWMRACDGRRTLAASSALLLVILLLVVPLGLVAAYAMQEAGQLVGWAVAANRDGAPVPEWIATLPMIGERLAGYWNQHLAQPDAIGQWVSLLSGEHLADLYHFALSTTGNLLKLALTTLFLLMTLFFVFRDGERLAAQLDVVGEHALPGRWQRFSRVVPATISSTVTGMGLIAIGEGVVLGLAYWIAGVPSPALLGVITGFMALIPGGAPLAMSLVSLYLVGAGYPVNGIALFAWGAIELFIVDKTLRPRLVGGPVKLPFLPTLFGLVGGVQTLGLIGLFVGPVLMALLVAIWREWVREAAEVGALPAEPALQDAPVVVDSAAEHQVSPQRA